VANEPLVLKKLIYGILNQLNF